MGHSVTSHDVDFVAQVVWQNWAHHIGIPWEYRIGEWCVFPMGTVPYGWPGDGHRLALEMTAAELDELRLSAPVDPPPIEPQPLPSHVPPPAPMPSPDTDDAIN